jgi:hypothetical protein
VNLLAAKAQGRARGRDGDWPRQQIRGGF